ncbi:MAG: hypothetical protein GAK28_00693 [Luteibacter sp.]|uniref:DUF7210 family protein n=1 Tax=Luteibacter sp. TaxID=1886636 RepID=UPI00138388D7|nr:hypothetical protein [Luteibacter sp.]KAF1009060.1 MAG: hypothetical protein GAK28_00693 [Luteibacter sp.]
MKVKLKAPHTHNGVAYVAGDEIEVNASQAAWLAEMQVIDPVLDGAGGKSAAPKMPAITENLA